MIKKFMILIMLTTISLLLFNQSVSADLILTPEPAANTGGLWHVEDGNRAYVFMRYTDGSTVIETGDASNSTYPSYDYSMYTYWPTGSENNYSFPNTSLYNDYVTISNPDTSVYDKFVVEIIPNMTVIDGPEPSFKVIESYDSIVSNISISLDNFDDRPNTDYLYDYSYITLSVDGDEILTSRNINQEAADALGFEVNPEYEDMSFGVRMYWEKSSVAEEIDPGITENPWEALPITSGSPVNPIGDWGTVSNINVVSQTISFDVEYEGVTYPVLPFTVAGNLDFIDESNDILYYSDPDTGDRVLYFNFGDTLASAILAASSFATVEEWEGEALWNLTQNEIKVTDVLTVYNYIPEVDEDGNVYSYFYMPDVPIENLISVSSVLAYQYYDQEYFGIFGDLVAGDMQYKTVAAVRGEVTPVNPSWVEQTYKNAYISGGIIAAATLTVPFIPVYGWGISGMFFLAGGALQASDVNEWFAYDVDQIQHVIPSVALTNEINTYISETGNDDQFTADTDKLYKLHLAVLDEYADVQIDNDKSNVTQVVWETDGEIYVVNEENIVDFWFGIGTDIPVNAPGNDDFELVVYIIAGFIVLYFISIVIKKMDKWILLLIIGAAAYYLYYLGLI